MQVIVATKLRIIERYIGTPLSKIFELRQKNNLLAGFGLLFIKIGSRFYRINNVEVETKFAYPLFKSALY